ncbi:hypothetical protein QAD02_012148, partial [Eretmocerus hayati]
SCLSYGHSCWGAHGKRSGQLDRRPEDASTSWTDRRLLQPRYFATGDDGSPSVLLSRLLRHPSEPSTQRLMRSMTSARQFEQEAPPAPPLMIIDGDDLPDASFSKRSSPLEKIANDGGMGHILRDNPKMADQLSSNDIVHSRPKESNIKNDQEMTLGLYKLLVMARPVTRSEPAHLMHAVLAEDEAMTSELLRSGVDPNVFDHASNSVWAHAIRTRNTTVVELLAAHGASLEIMDTNGTRGNSLQAALRDNQLHMMLRLIELGANVNHVNSLRESVLDTCLECLFDNCYDNATCGLLFQYLVRRGAMIHKMKSYPFVPQDFFTFGSVTLLQTLIDHGLSIRTDYEVATSDLPLHLALDNYTTGLLKSLICTHKLNIDQRDQFGSTVFLQAAENLQLSQMHLLYQLGANVDVYNFQNVSSLQSTILPHVITQCFKWLITVCSIETIFRTLVHVVSIDNHLYQMYVLKYLAFLDSCKPIEGSDRMCESISESCLALYQSCKHELVKSKLIPIGGVALYEIFSVTDESLIARNSLVQQEMQNQDLVNQFPIYWDDLYANFSRAAKHQNSIAKAGKSLCNLFQCEYYTNHLAIEKICSYLDQTYLENLGGL